MLTILIYIHGIQTNEKTSAFTKFAEGILQGKLENDEVFFGLVRAMAQKIDRKERGVGMQNIQYAPAWDEFIHIMKIYSPRAYRFLAQQFPARAERQIRFKESKESKLPFTICQDTFTLVKSHLSTLEYAGPVAVSCDDTKLFSSLRLHWDQKRET
ncbi:hypothetical protein PM082_018355 [Marasmius tenuissimus]|nr:hypothetical protein PM082_018355 [Marasmius tenuissimus]